MKIVNDARRTILHRGSKYAEYYQAILDGKTVFLSDDEVNYMSFVVGFRKNPAYATTRLRSHTDVEDGERGHIFWVEKR